MSCIDKQNILAHAPNDEQRLMLAHTYDVYARYKKTGIKCFTRFLTPADSDLAARAFGKDSEVCLFGGYEAAERVIVGFSAEKEEFPIDVIVSHGNFSDVTHRDFLGSLMSLGITRGAIGDIIVCENVSYIFSEESLTDYIMESLCEVKKEKVINEKKCFSEINIERRFEEMRRSVASERADAVVGAVFSLSRQDAAECISHSAVTLNYMPLTQKDKKINSGDVISVRGKGKAIVEFSGDLSKKGRLFLDIKKYK